MSIEMGSKELLNLSTEVNSEKGIIANKKKRGSSRAKRTYFLAKN